MNGAPAVTAGHLRALDAVLSPQGWPYASTAPVDADDPGRFHALFGRDSLIFGLQVLPVRPAVAAATLRALAALQGRADDPERDEEPGKILHEYWPTAPQRLLDLDWPVHAGGVRYYGTTDATSWFLVLLDATGDTALQAELTPARQAAAGWLERALHRGRGLVRSGPRRLPGGLAQHGWRDARFPGEDLHGCGIVGTDRTAPTPPLADADSQAAAVAALRALTRLDPARAGHWHDRLGSLRRTVEQRFLPEVMALDGHDRPVPGAGSQLGWLLWSGALDTTATRETVDRLIRPDVFTEAGLRTLSDTHPAFRVDGYHRGGVWPFDNWIGWGGLLAAGEQAAAEQVRTGVRAAVARLGRYPELYGVERNGHDVRRLALANHVQAWTVGAMVAFDLNWTGLSRTV